MSRGRIFWCVLLLSSMAIAQSPIVESHDLPSAIGTVGKEPAASEDDTAYVQGLVDAGAIVPPGTYVLRRTIVVRRPYTVVQGSGPKTIFIFQPSLPLERCVNDRAFTTSCDSFFNPITQTNVNRRQIAAPISIGDSSFQTVDDSSKLRPGDWLVITDNDSHIGPVAIDWVQVASAVGNTVRVTIPFRTAFPIAYSWDPVYSGLGFFKVVNPVHHVRFRNFTVEVPDSSIHTAGISIYNAQHVVVENLNVQESNGQALYSFLSQDVTFRNCFAYSGKVLSEFASTVDLTLRGNEFSSIGDASFGLDLGIGFFDVRHNKVTSSLNVGMYVLYAVHDGNIERNSIGIVPSQQSAIGILVRGAQNVTITHNYLAGGQGPHSIGLSIGPELSLDVPIESYGNVVSPNTFGTWYEDYDPDNQP
ncbi:right-handed parallel beta-helix repeat-containing protein [Alloacidobacterium dinghuense]|uniref:Right-handed parallel beta-helix repeat-containing protein n=1 Tax=Alloacidobacterium dinghuense TaxID=2763107 RepID=A0A7G8BDZ5_9BACT|nr:right-handed parallel beta-helix repeat-containing protein [Alloacidobacterium dinghuense]QNI30765.1 right-handed parallel beta-helix repeat-containing protein [Alloacidobacterium dinghuense]